MDRLTLTAQYRTILGKKVKKLRQDGLIPAHVFGKKVAVEHISIKQVEFKKIYDQAGETGLIDLATEGNKVRPVMVRDTQYDPVSGKLLHIDFYQVNLTQKVRVNVPIELVGEEPESVRMGESVVLQTLNEVSVEGLPTDLVDKIAVDISSLQAIDDAITVADLQCDRSKLTVLVEGDEIVVKLAPAVTEEMQRLLEEQQAEVQAASEAAAQAVEVQAEEASVEEGAEQLKAEEVVKEAEENGEALGEEAMEEEESKIRF